MAARVELNSLTLAKGDAKPSARGRAARLLEGVIFCALLLLIPLTAIPYGTVDGWWQSAFQCVVLALTALWSIEGLLGGRWFVREHRLLAPLAPLLGFVFIQAVPFGRAEVAGVEVWRALSADAYGTRLAAFRFLALILAAAMLLRYTSSRRRLDALIYAVVGTGVASALFGVVRQAAHYDQEGFLLPHLKPQLGYGQFTNNNHFALLMEMSLGLSLGLLAGGGARRQGVRLFLYTSAAVLVWAALVLSNSRGGIFAMIGEVVFVCLLSQAGRSRRRAQGVDGRGGAGRGRLRLVARYGMAACALSVIAVGVVWMGGEQLVRRVENLHSEVGEEGAGNRMYPRRVEMWQATCQMIRDHPFAGSGFGGYWLAVDSHYDATGVSVPQQAHNDYLELLASGGLVAAAFAAWFVGALLVRARKCMRSRESFRRAACFGALAGLFSVALHSLVDFGLHVTVNALACTALVVIAVAHVRPDERATAGDEGLGHYLPSRMPYAGGLGGGVRRGAARAWAVSACLLVCAAAMWATGRAGLSNWCYMSHARESSPSPASLSAVERAIRLSPSDPAAHSFRAWLLSAEGRDDEAMAESISAVSLRPHDYVLWTSLGLARVGAGDKQGAAAAFEQAARLAPFYAQPHWHFGTALLRAGQREQSLGELARAAESNPKFLPQTLVLLWAVLGGNVEAMERLLPPQSVATRLAFVRFFIEHGRADEAMSLLRQAEGEGEAERRLLTTDLIAAKRFTEAYGVWSSGGRRDGGSGGGLSVVADGSFEEGIDANDAGFGWQVTGNAGSVHLAFDTKEPREGARSLLLDFRGDSPARAALVSQLILVEADTSYRLAFSARTRGLKTNGPLSVELVDAGDGQALTKPTLLPTGDNGWQDYAVEFATGRETGTVLLAVRRQECPMQPCLVFGRVWLDGFSLRKP